MKKKSVWVKIREERSAYYFILPAVVMFSALVAVPIFLSFLYSFQQRSLVRWKWIGFENYTDLLTDPYFINALQNTITFVIILVPVVVLLTFIVSLQVTPLKSGFRVFFRAAFYIPVVASGVVIGMVWLWIFDPNYGLLNYVLSLFGADSVVWLSSKYTLYYLIFVVFTFVFGLPFIIYIAAMGNIPKQLLEAARIDGAKKRTITWKIVFPLLKPVTFFIAVTQTIFIFMVFVVIQLLTDGGPARQTETVIYSLYKTAFQFLEFGRASAMGIILLILVMVISILQKLFAGRDLD